MFFTQISGHDDDDFCDDDDNDNNGQDDDADIGFCPQTKTMTVIDDCNNNHNFQCHHHW